MRLRDYADVLRGGWVLMLVATAVGALIGWGLSAVQPRDYTATTDVYVSISDGADPNSLYQMGEYMRSQMVTYAALAQKPIVLNPVAEQMGGDMTADRLSEMVTVNVPSESYLMEIVVSSADARVSADASVAIAESMETQIEAVAPQYQDQPLIDLSVMDRPEAAPAPEAVPTGLWTAAGAIIGLVLGLLLAFLRHCLRHRDAPAGAQAAERA